MIGALAIAALVLSVLLFAGMITLLVVLRRGEGPRYGANREYDASRREAIRILTGMEVDAIPGEQWFRRMYKRPVDDTTLATRFKELVTAALEVVVPSDREVSFDEEGNALIVAEDVWVVPAISTAGFRAAGLERWDDRGRMTVGLVLFNPEPPGGATTRVTLPVQVLFGPLESAGRDDLVREIRELAEAR